MSQASLETSLESLRHGLVFCDSSSLFEGMESSDIASCEERLQNTTGKSEELRKTYPLIESLAQIREADLDPMALDEVILPAGTQLHHRAHIDLIERGQHSRGLLRLD